MTKKLSFKQISFYIVVFLVALSIVFEIAYHYNAVDFSPSKYIENIFSASSENSESEFIRFSDVGQGDCTIIKSKDKCAIIDFGGENASDKLYWELKSLGISKIDFAIVTHWHSDHLGGLCDVMEKMSVNNIVISETFADDCDFDTVNRFYSLLKTTDTKIINPETGMKTTVGSSVITVIYQNKTADKENNRSLITKVDFHNVSVMIMGDAETETEKGLINSGVDISADILKLGHHGSNTSTGIRLLEAISPDIAIVSCGYNNLYNHPSDKTVDRLISSGIKYYRTDFDGGITVKFNDNNFSVTTERQEEN